MAWVKPHQTTSIKYPSGWELCFQWCTYHYDDGTTEDGYRFIWKRDDGSLQAARGQARIPSLCQMRKLMKQAEKEGWHRLGDACCCDETVSCSNSDADIKKED